MHDEATARRLWCPMVRIVIGPETSTWQCVAVTNRCQELDTDKVNCIASSCMMWRWEPQREWLDKVEKAIAETNGAFDQHAIEEMMEMLPRQGYCGLGGRP